MNQYGHVRRTSRVLVGGGLMAVLFAFTAYPALAEDAAKSGGHLLYLLADPTWPQAESLAQCDRLTVEKYRGQGTKVTEKSYADLDRWLEGDGKSHANAHSYFKYLAFAKAVKADAVGGLNFNEISEDMASRFGMEAGIHFTGWGIALRGCSRDVSMFGDSGASVRAIPLRLAGGEGDPWSVPLSVEARGCTPSMRSSAMVDSPNKGRPFLGVALKEMTIANVVADSPAAAAGLVEGDTLVSVAGEPVKDTTGLREALKPRAPGDEIEIEFKHGDVLNKKKIKLADYYESVEAKQAQPQEGKSLPALVGQDIEGKEVRLHDLKGKVVVLDFWATWCGPCREEMPLQQLLWERVKDKDYVWIGVSADDDEQAWKDFVRNNHLGGIQVRNSEWANSMFINGFPTVLIADRAGVIRCDVRGEDIAKAALAMLNEK